MPDKKVILYDSSNSPLQIAGIRVELYDASSKAYVDGDDSDDLNPASRPSDQWGVVLNFGSGATPVDIYVSDPTYKYPGNTLRYLNGDLADEVLMDLMQLPSGPGGQPSITTRPSVPEINTWVDSGAEWTNEEREAVRNLIFNFAQSFTGGEKPGSISTNFSALRSNWESALRRVGLNPSLLQNPRRQVSKASY
jgi:hypothetical protein